MAASRSRSSVGVKGNRSRRNGSVPRWCTRLSKLAYASRMSLNSSAHAAAVLGGKKHDGRIFQELELVADLLFEFVAFLSSIRSHLLTQTMSARPSSWA